MKTPYDSYLTTPKPCKGCQLCLRGLKLVLFIGGKCSRNCWYCSLSEGRKNSDTIWANERQCKTNSDIAQEALDSNSKGAGITGGDPLAYFQRTLSAAKTLKKRFGKKFHIHIYLPFPLVNKQKLQKLHPYIDEIRFHTSFLTNPDKTLYNEELEKLHLASQIFDKQNVGIELPLLPDKKQELIQYIQDASPFISFANLNEFEISDTNFNLIEKNYKLNPDTYTIKNSIKTGKQILNHFKKSNITIHLCTAKTKNHHQYHNRLLRRNILPYGEKTPDATVIYIEIPNINKEIIKNLRKHTKKFHIDNRHNRILLDHNEAQKIFQTKQFDLHLCEEHPTFDAEKMSYWKLTKTDFQ